MHVLQVVRTLWGETELKLNIGTVGGKGV